MIRRLIILIVSSLAAISCSSTTPNDVASVARTGERSKYAGGIADTYPVGAIPDVVLHDDAREKDVRVNIEYPIRPAGPHPLIVFSPAFRLTNRDYVGLSSYWASRGYVVIRASHADRGEEITQTATNWRDRARDVTFILDRIPQLITRYPELNGKIDATKIGVAGHGYGAHTALLLAGAQTFPGGAQYGDPRVTAAIAISPPGLSEARGLTRESWSAIRVPVLFLTGSLDQGAVESETPEWRREGFALLPAGDKWLVVIQGARHGTFAGRFDDLMEQAARQRARDNPPNPGVERTVPRGQTPSRAENVAYQQQSVINLSRGLALAFWDTYLRTNAEAREALETAGARMNVVVEKR